MTMSFLVLFLLLVVVSVSSTCRLSVFVVLFELLHFNLF
jgi:hypothetical protein